MHFQFILVDGVTCDPLTAPDNGLIDCSLGGDNVPNEGEACKFSCNDGFQLEGSTSRKCRSSGKWNGRDATCVGGTVCYANMAIQCMHKFFS